MRILIVQLARLGDIYQGWPTIRALKRQHPESQITLLTRNTFEAASRGLPELDKVIVLSTKDVMAPLVSDQADIVAAFGKLKEFVEGLKAENYDLILNFSFSPASSWLCRVLDPGANKTRGYTRTSDGYLAIPDDMSAYFYAQVGPGKPNRFHLAEIFGTLAGVDLEPSDWAGPVGLDAFQMPRSGPYLAIHIGASENHKSLSASKWASIINHYKKTSVLPVALIGGTGEKAIADSIMGSVSGDQVMNLVGLTTLTESFQVIAGATILVGCDSAPMHMASLTGTRCLNLSLGRTNFWETGPRSKGSWILRGATEEDMASDRIATLINLMLEKGRAPVGIIQTQEGTPSYSGLFPKDVEFQWKFTQAIYQGTPFPEPVSDGFWQALDQLTEVNQFLIEQLEAIRGGAALESLAALMDRGEEVIGAIARIVPAWAPAIAWYQTEKLRIGPGDQGVVLDRTIEIQGLMAKLLEVYQDMKAVHQEPTAEAT